MATSGINECVAYCLKHPGRSLFELACQGSELIIGLAKLFCAQLGTGKDDMPHKLADYLDSSGICMVIHNKIDIAKILRRLLSEKKNIFNNSTTVEIEKQIEAQFPCLMIHLVKICDRWEPQHKTPSLLHQIHSCVKLSPNAWHINEIKDITANCIGINVSSGNDIDENSDEFKQVMQELSSLSTNPNANKIFKFEKAKICKKLDRK